MRNADDLRTVGEATRDRRMVHRHLCSDLITVRWGMGRREAAVIEDYSSVGASLSMEVKIEKGTAITLATEWESFRAVVRHCEWRDRGYQVGVQFDQPRPEEEFMPAHSLDPAKFGV